MWRLDCRLKYVCYLLETRVNFMIFVKFMVKYAYFWRSLWRALHIISPTPIYAPRPFCLEYLNKNNERRKYERFVWRCEWFEGYLLPTMNSSKFNDFSWFWGKKRLFLKVLMAGVALKPTPRFRRPFSNFYILKIIKQTTKLKLIYLCDGWTVVWSISAT